MQSRPMPVTGKSHVDDRYLVDAGDSRNALWQNEFGTTKSRITDSLQKVPKLMRILGLVLVLMKMNKIVN